MQQAEKSSPQSVKKCEKKGICEAILILENRHKISTFAGL